MIRHRLFILLLWFAIVDARAADTNPRRTNTTPNIILILADDLGYGELGSYGQTKIRTPNLDRLAAEGMRFTDAYAGNTVCAPSRSALLTGKHSGHGRVRSNVQVPLAPEDVTIAEVLRAAGYHTGAFGKWALGWEGTTGTPNKKGFEEWFGYLDQVHAHDYYPAYLWRNDVQRWLAGNEGGKRGEYAPDWFAKVAANFVRLNEDNAFFLYFPTIIPHANNELGTNGMQVPSLGIYDKEPWPAAEKAKAAMITRLDAFVGTLMEDLRKRKIDRDTLILFSSDNGPHREGGVNPAFFHSAGPFRGIKRELYEGGIRVPLLARWPGHIRPGMTNSQPIAFWDMLPTIAELVGVEPPKGLDGLSFAPALFGKEPARTHAYLYWEFHEKGYQQAVRRGPWKGVRPDADQPLELYNLAHDPGETHNVAAGHPDMVKQLEADMKEAADPWVQPEEKSPYATKK
jgi:arylsulfatase A-like enzyme